MNIPQNNEASLLKKAKNGDKDAFNLMVIKYQPRIMSVLYGFLKTHSDAEDLTQQTFIKAWTNLEKFRGDSSFYTWIYRIAINLAKNFVKKPSTQIEKTSISIDEHQYDLPEDLDPLSFISNEQLKNDLNSFILARIAGEKSLAYNYTIRQRDFNIYLTFYHTNCL